MLLNMNDYYWLAQEFEPANLIYEIFVTEKRHYKLVKGTSQIQESSIIPLYHNIPQISTPTKSMKYLFESTPKIPKNLVTCLDNGIIKQCFSIFSIQKKRQH